MFVCCLLQAQLKIHPDYIDFGKVGPSTDRVADLIVINHGNTAVTFLRHSFSPEFEVRQTSKTILPDSSIVIRLKFKPRRKGSYSEKPELWFSSMGTPLVVPVEAEVDYLATTDTPCPDFSARRAECCPTNMFLAEVIDKQTGQPVRDAVVEIREQKVVQKKLKTQTDGRVTQWIPIGYYELTATKDGYSSHTVHSYVNKNFSFFRFEIERKPTPPAAKTPPPPPPVITPVPQVSPIETLPPPVVEQPVVTPLPEISAPPVAAVEESLLMPESRYKPNNIVFVVDVSESMGENSKLDLMKSSLLSLSDALRPSDKIGVVSYSKNASLLLPSTSGDHKSEIAAIVQGMQAGGLTSGFNGFRQAYKELTKNKIQGGNNQVIVITDGLFRPEDGEKINRLIQQEAARGVLTSIVGIKCHPATRKILQQYTDRGNGTFVPIEDVLDKDAVLEEIKRRSLRSGG